MLVNRDDHMNILICRPHMCVLKDIHVSGNTSWFYISLERLQLKSRLKKNY